MNNAEYTKAIKDLIYNNFKDEIKDVKDIDDIYNALNELGIVDRETYMSYFITDELNVFNSKEEAFVWFISDEPLSIVAEEIKDIKISSNLIGETIGNAAIIMFLNNKENYLKVNDHIYLTWWL